MGLKMTRRPGEALAIRHGEDLMVLTVNKNPKGAGATIDIECPRDFKIVRLEKYIERQLELEAQIKRLEQAMA